MLDCENVADFRTFTVQYIYWWGLGLCVGLTAAQYTLLVSGESTHYTGPTWQCQLWNLHNWCKKWSWGSVALWIRIQRLCIALSLFWICYFIMIPWYGAYVALLQVGKRLMETVNVVLQSLRLTFSGTCKLPDIFAFRKNIFAMNPLCLVRILYVHMQRILKLLSGVRVLAYSQDNFCKKSLFA